METLTSSGRVRGSEKDGVTRFLGVPYAAPPVRFAAPTPAPRWDGVRDATAPGPNAPQPPRPFGPLDLSPVIGSGWRPGSADQTFLTVDVWTAGGSGLPVMVFLHGGAFIAGEPGAPAYDGTALARAGVVLVSVTYRLGAEGFLPLPGGDTNLGLRDQLAALAWVQENAAAFGGDPANVTVFGESAGAMSIGCLLGSPASAGLFRRAIVQSGGAELVHSVPVLARYAERLAAELGVPATAEGLASRSVPDTLAAVAATVAPGASGDLREPDGVDPGYGVGVFSPIVGDDVVPGVPVDAIAEGASAGVDVLAGANSEETNLYLVPTGVRDAMTEEQAVGALSLRHPQAAEFLAAAEGTPGERYAAVVTEQLFHGPTRRLLEAHGGRSWIYEFAWRSPSFGGELGACHALDVPFVFGTLESSSGPDALAGEHPPQELSDAMVRAWTSFATTGDPGWAPGTSRRFA